MSITNAGPVAFPFGLGWHPFFPREPATRLGFSAASMWETDATVLPTHESRGHAPFDPPRAIEGAALDNAFAGWPGEATLEWPASGLGVRLDADRMLDHLVVYIPPGRDFLAVEPVTHMTDAFNRDARGLPHTGTRYLPPGQSRSCTMRIIANLR
jgi:aldose 1-epimerase